MDREKGYCCSRVGSEKLRPEERRWIDCSRSERTAVIGCTGERGYPETANQAAGADLVRCSVRGSVRGLCIYSCSTVIDSSFQKNARSIRSFRFIYMAKKRQMHQFNWLPEDTSMQTVHHVTCRLFWRVSGVHNRGNAC